MNTPASYGRTQKAKGEDDTILPFSSNSFNTAFSETIT